MGGGARVDERNSESATRWEKCLIAKTIDLCQTLRIGF